MKRFLTIKNLLGLAGLVLAVVLLYRLSVFNYLLFHCLVEFFSIVIAFAIFMFALNSRKYMDNNFLLFVGVAYLFVGGLDLLHTLGYKGMHVLASDDPNLATQLWIAARYLESVSLLAASFLVSRRMNLGLVVAGYCVVFGLIVGSILVWGVFPDCYVAPEGLTPFKKMSEYTISLILGLTIARLVRKRREFEPGVFFMLTASLALTIGSELAFTFYIGVYDFSNMVGHLFKVFSFYLIYKAIIETGLIRPYDLLFLDIRRREQALAESDRRFRTMSDYTHDWEYWLGPDGRFVYNSPSCERITGYSPAEFEADGGLLERIINPQDRRSFSRDFSRRLAPGEVYSTDLRISAKNGEEKWLNHHGRGVYDENGRYLGLRASNREITQRKQMEESLVLARGHLENIIEFLPDATFVIDAQGKVTNWNKAIEEMTGIAKEEMIGRGDYAYAMPFYGHSRPILIDLACAENPAVESLYDFFERSEDRLFSQVYLPRMNEGKGMFVWSTARPIYDARGGLAGAIESIRDITEQKKAEQELKKAKETAEKLALTAENANRAKSDFLARVSHEIRTPLNGVVGFTEMLLEEELTHDQRAWLEIILKSSDTLLNLLGDILDLSKIEADRMELEELEVNLENLVIDAVSITAARASEKPIEFLVNLRDAPLSVMADPTRLRQILLNLLSNAAKFTENGEIEISVKTLEQTSNRIHLAFGVRDTGIGMSAEIIEKVFEPFSQGDESTTRRFSGTGLGLAITRQLVSLMRGRVSVVSKPGQGSTFTLDLWFKKAPPSGQAKPVAPSGLKGLNVLLVDDNENSLAILEDITAKLGMRPVAAGSGAQALKAMAARSFDLALMDIRMPGMDGYELARRIKDTLGEARPKMVALSSDMRHTDQGRLNRSGFHGFMAKPVRRSVLARLIGSVMGLEGPEEATVTQFGLPPEPTRQLNVLLAEDNPANQRVAQAMLKKMGHRVTLARDGHQAVELAAAGQVDIILMDVQMPGMDGLEATRQLRQKGVKTPIVAMTAYAMKGDRERCLAAGMDDYIPKPLKKSVIQEKLGRHAKASPGAAAFKREARILVVAGDAQAAESLRSSVAALAPAALVRSSQGLFQALLLVGGFLPDVLILDLSGQEEDCARLTQELKNTARYARIRVLVLTNGPLDPRAHARLTAAGVAGILIRPLGRERLGQALSRLFDPSFTLPAQPDAPRLPTPGEIAEELGLEENEYHEVLALFLADAQAKMKRIEAALAQGLLDQAGVLAHDIKGSAMNLRLDMLAARALALEKALEAGEAGDLDAARKLACGLARYQELARPFAANRPATLNWEENQEALKQELGRLAAPGSLRELTVLMNQGNLSRTVELAGSLAQRAESKGLAVLSQALASVARTAKEADLPRLRARADLLDRWEGEA